MDGALDTRLSFALPSLMKAHLKVGIYDWGILEDSESWHRRKEIAEIAFL